MGRRKWIAQENAKIQEKKIVQINFLGCEKGNFSIVCI